MITVKKLKEKIESNDYDITNLNDEESELFNRIDTLNNHESKLVKHFNKKFYLILGVVEHTQTSEEMVVYKAMYGNYKKYVMPIDIFLSKVDKNKYPDIEQEYNFMFIELI